MTRFLALLSSLALALVLAYLTVYFWGRGRSFPQFTNEFLSQPAPWLVYPWDQEPPSAPAAGTAMRWLDVVRDKEGLLRLVPTHLRELTAKNLADSPDLGPQLRQYADDKKGRFLIVNVLSNVSDIDRQVAEELAREWDGRVLIQSEFEPILSQTQNQRPMFAYGASAPDRLRWLTYRSLGLLPAVNYNRDVYVTPLYIHRQLAVSESIVEEVHRRNRKILVGPLISAEDVREAKNFGPDGYILFSQAAAAAVLE